MILGIDHVGISVTNLERSVAFYRDILGMEILSSGPFEGDLYERIMGLKGARGQAAMLRRGNLQVELFEFFYPVPIHADPQRPVCHHGITHFCLRVVDIASEYEKMQSAGVIFHCPPLDFGGTTKATYGRDPDGNVFELLQTQG